MAPRAAAFFDLDKTLMAGSSGMAFGRAAFRSGLVGRRVLLGWGVEHLRYRLKGSTDESTQQVMDQVEELLGGIPARDIARLMPDLLAGILPRIYPQMLAEVREHQDAGRAAFIVSAAGHELVSMLAEVLQMEGGIGTRYEVTADGVLTGRIEDPFMYGEGKEEAVRRFADEHDLDLEHSWAYSDSASDLPMLRAVGHAVVVNPDAELAAIAKHEGWRIMRFEKLGRRLALTGAGITAALLGISGRFVRARRRTPARQSPLRRRK
jgi:HAD superfamily hydrolase (TIGR01490 family)